MAFSRISVSAIWKREGGAMAQCFTCGRAFKDGWSLDASHLDHQHNENYDDPAGGVLECLWCHLKRHINNFYESLIADPSSKKSVRENRYACQAIWARILAGEDRYNRGQIMRSHGEIKLTKRQIAELFMSELTELDKKAKKKSISKELRLFAKKKIEEMANIVN